MDVLSVGGSNGARDKIFAIACAFRDVYGNDGQALYERALQRIKDKSPVLDKPSPKTGDVSNPIARELKDLGAWNAASSRKAWLPLTLEELRGVPGRGAYLALDEYRRRNRLAPHRIGVSSRDLGAVMERAHHAAQNQLKTGGRSGIIVQLYSGYANCWDECSRRVLPGPKGIYGLVGQGETVLDVLSDAMSQRRFLNDPEEDIALREALALRAVLEPLVVRSSMRNRSHVDWLPISMCLAYLERISDTLATQRDPDIWTERQARSSEPQRALLPSEGEFVKEEQCLVAY